MLIRHIPNFITCLNLWCGCMAVVAAFDNRLMTASCLVGIAAVLDFMDGLAARALKAYSPIGKELDSLADMVTFGLVPAVMLFQLFLYSSSGFVPYLAFLISVFSALRLAKFNVDQRQTDLFIGLPTPANALFIASLPLIMEFQPVVGGIAVGKGIVEPVFLACLTLLLSYLMIAEIPLFSLKFKTRTWAGNKVRVLFLSAALGLLIIFHFIAVPIILFLYVILSLIVKPQVDLKK